MFFCGSNLGPLARGHLGTWNLHLKKTWLKASRQCYIPNFKHLGQVVMKKNFEYISMYFYGSNLGNPAEEPSWTMGPLLEQTWERTTRQWYISNFEHQSQAVLEKKIFTYISFLKPRLTAQGHFEPFYQTVEVYQAMLHTKYQGPRPSAFEEDVVSSKLLTTDDA